MSQKALNIILAIVILAVGGMVLYFTYFDKDNEVLNPGGQQATSTPETPSNGSSEQQIEYRNNEYGFRFLLPQSWSEYSLIEDEWEGETQVNNGQVSVVIEKGPLLSFRHPDWDYKSPRQDIPIMVFTKVQWDSMQQGKFHIGAAPINPSELGRNNLYVFALPARYNFSFLTGYEEVEMILKSNPLKPF